MRIGITIVGSRDAARDLIKLLRKSVVQDIPGSKLAFEIVPPERPATDVVSNSNVDPTDDLYEAAAIAEQKREECEDDLHAYVLAASTTIHGFDTGGTAFVPLLAVAVAHPGGIGSISVDPIIEQNSLPPVAMAEMLKKLREINEQMRPRSKDKRNTYAVRLSDAIVRPITNIRP
ncbi:MAG: hypothetical protein WC050_00705 [Candidatus Paceibacterota bacterium]